MKMIDCKISIHQRLLVAFEHSEIKKAFLHLPEECKYVCTGKYVCFCNHINPMLE